MLTCPQRRMAVLVAALTLIPATSASAAPRLTDVSTPPRVDGRNSFVFCSAITRVPLSFTASQPGTALVTRVQTWPVNALGALPGFGRVTFRAGANTIDLSEWSRGAPQTDRGTSFVTLAITLLPFNSRWQVGPAVTRTVRLACS